DGNGGEDIASISFELIENGNSLGNVGTVTNFNIATWDDKWSNFGFQLDLASLSLTGGTYQIVGQARDSFGVTSNLFQRSFLIESIQSNDNNAPQNLVFNLSQNAYEATDTIQIQSGWINDLDGASDLANIVFSLWQNGSELDAQSLNVLNPAPWNDKWASFSYDYEIANLGLSSGNYTLRGVAYDQTQANSNTFERSLQIIDPTPVNQQPTSLQFSLDSNSYTLTDTLALERGWVMDEDGAQDLDKVSLSLWQNGSKLADIGEITNLTPATWNDKWASFSETYAIADWNLELGNYTLQATAYDIGGLASDQFERSFAIAPASTIDLRGQSFDITSNSADAGASVTANFQLQNLGNSASGTFRAGFYLSTDATITVNDRLLSFVDFDSLNAGESSNILSQVLNIPDGDDPFWQGSGNYYIGMILDDLGAIAESNENNNASQGIGTDLDSIEIILPAAIDLKANSFDITSNSVNTGTSITANFQVQNAGNGDAGAFRVGFYLSTDEAITVSDRLLDFVDINGLNAGELTNTLSQVLNLPQYDDSFWQGNGNYYIGLIVDDLGAIAESNENNNASQGIGTDLDSLNINVSQPSRDLRGESFSLNASTLNAGDSFDITWEFTNAGTERLENIGIGFYISEDSTITTSDRFMGGLNLSWLNGGQTWGTTSNRTLPDRFRSDVWTKGSGTYYIGMIVDYENAIVEDIESNNSNLGIGIDFAEIQVNDTGIFNTTGNNDIDSLLNEQRMYWEGGQGSTSPNTVTYSFYQNSSGAYYGSEANVTELDENIKTNVREVLSNLSQFINLDFQEVADTANSYGVMRFMFSSTPDYAFAYYPHPSDTGGDVFFNPSYRNDSLNWFGEGKGSHGYTTIIHEILHALGLKHPGQYGNDDVNPFLTGEQDNLGNTVMTYNFNFQGKAITPMSYDIRALQYLYGARNSNHSDTTYTFTEVDSYSIGNQSFGSTTDKIKQTVWDSGGIDIFDASNLAVNESYRFDLREGGVITTQSSYDSINYNDEGGRGSFSTYNEGTAIAFNTIIENLITSRSSDYIFANSANNVFSGYVKGTIAGNDWFEGFDNSDLLNLNSYNLMDITEEILGNDLKLTLGTDGSITLKDYFGSNGVIRKQIDGQYYTYSQTSGWQATTAPGPIIPSPDNTEISTSGTDAIAITNPVNTPLINAIDNNSLSNPVISLVEIEHPPIDTPLPARCGCAFHLAGGGLSYARSASLADMMGLSPV
ncbi:MAG: CARDB domain-containing protein, partial [Cyanobacteria bacterium P01_E01_bin.42]